MAIGSTKMTIRVGAAQMVFDREIEGNLRLIDEAARAAKRKKVDAVLFPECATTSYTYDYSRLNPGDPGDPGVVRDAMRACGETARRYGIYLLVGTPLILRGKLYNALVVFDRKGKPIHAYAKCQLTPGDAEVFEAGNALSIFKMDGVVCTSVICHERRYPELVRLPVMAGAQVLFHPNAGLDSLKVSKAKRGGKDGVVARAFENGIYYVFANCVGEQAVRGGGGGKWSAGDSKIVGPGGEVLALADNEQASVIAGTLDLEKATRVYAVRSMENPKYLKGYWKAMVKETKRRSAEQSAKLIAGFS